MLSNKSVLVGFLAANLLAASIALGLSGGVAFVSWLVPEDIQEVEQAAPLVVD